LRKLVSCGVRARALSSPQFDRSPATAQGDARIGRRGTASILGHTGDIARFPTSGHYARYTRSAPIAASSGPKQRHRLNPRGNRQLNRALHVAAVTQVRNDTAGRAYYRRKLDECKTRKEALRALKRQIAKTGYRHLVADANH
jgi:transposase